MDLLTFNAFCENILDYHEQKLLREPEHIISEYETVPRAKDLWHIQSVMDKAKPLYFLWRKRAWLLHEDRQRQLKQDQAEYNRVLDIRRAAFDNLRRAIIQTLELDVDSLSDPMVVKMAEKVMAKRTEASELLFGVKLSDLPELPHKHIVLQDNGKKLYEL